MTPTYEHLGDGAYVSFDGQSFGFAANHHLNTSIQIKGTQCDLACL